MTSIPQRSDADRIVVTGVGLVTSLGLGLAPTWAGLKAGRVATAPITRFDTAGLHTRFACLLPDGLEEAARARFKRRFLRTLSDTSRAVLLATDQMLEDFAIPLGAFDPARVGVCIGLGIGVDLSPDRIEKEAADPYGVVRNMHNAAAGRLGQHYGLLGPCHAVATACASGGDAAGQGVGWLKLGVCDQVIVGGADVVVSRYLLQSFAAAMALSERNDDPSTASRPFDRDRDGFVVGEGAGVLMLERLSDARARGATVLCEHLAYASTTERGDVMRPEDGGVGMARTLGAALAASGRRPSEVDYVNAHGTSTVQNDLCETLAIQAVLGDRARGVAVSSQKSMLGHTLGAAGAIELGVTALSIHEGFVTPTMSHKTPGPGMTLDYVAGEGRAQRVEVAMSNSFGFGGHNSCHVLARLRE